MADDLTTVEDIAQKHGVGGIIPLSELWAHCDAAGFTPDRIELALLKLAETETLTTERKGTLFFCRCHRSDLHLTDIGWAVSEVCGVAL